MESIFTRIIKGEIPSYKVAENEKFYAFLDINPIQIGHTLIVPKEQVDYLFDLNDDSLAEMMLFAKQVARQIKQKIQCERVGVLVIGFEIPHTHIHLIPINKEGDMDVNHKLHISSEELSKIASLLQM